MVELGESSSSLVPLAWSVGSVPRAWSPGPFDALPSAESPEPPLPMLSSPRPSLEDSPSTCSTPSTSPAILPLPALATTPGSAVGAVMEKSVGRRASGEVGSVRWS
ncbi:uncharacterized protein SCHCODRAFT_02071676 [Schizophyllum commune H4-8]|uniref:uncharacterized protein n=1 Tax=Schizophyllum commune (strain H4-8 / FGSC 9210) TaxID=578458 RepID=UPI00215E7F98|nr:uncharacterized protein SCHCODRAFT_02071676 [Schizophyllum commune H4-8]KAI5887748.1 hypothetical protein SCHCODRAFT_02071676 [Schizophyllum commune H4-8]